MIRTPSRFQESEVRIENSLNENEEEFVRRRLQTVQQCLKRNGMPCSLHDVPKIALLGSGGGERAMLGLLGSLVALKKTDLLDSITYLSGVSGSTWCMASVYQEAGWSTKLDSVKEKIIQKLCGPGVSWDDTWAKLKNYYYGKDIFSLTDVWAVLVVTTYVKEIDEHTLSEQGLCDKDPFPIYTVIDKQCKQLQKGDPWVEITPEEAGYSLTGAFVDVSGFGSKFNDGVRIKDQTEMDMLYLQEFFRHIIYRKETFGVAWKEDKTPPAEDVYQVLMDLVEMNLLALKEEDTTYLNQAIRTKLNKLSGGKSQLVFQVEKLNKTKPELYMMQFTTDVCNFIKDWCYCWPLDVCWSICSCMAYWTWGRKYNFLYNITDECVPDILWKSKTRDYEDAGLLLNSPYFSVLRPERDVDLIISLDFSDGDPFLTLTTAADICKKLNMPFPDVTGPNDPQTPTDFYVFRDASGAAPTVIHIPLFNTVNCRDRAGIEWYRNEYRTFQGPYSREMIKRLLEVAGKNITNNKSKLLKEIKKLIESPVAKR